MTDLRPRLMLVELNEFDPEFLLTASRTLGLKRIPEVLALPHATTTTEDRVEHQGLDPWVQWVNVHCGQQSSVHGIKRLGQTARQTMPQVWTRLSQHGLRWGAWGPMNAPRQTDVGCEFFFPDPWSFEEDAFPARLNSLLRLPRYMSKNYLDVDRAVVVREALHFASALVRPELWKTSLTFTTTMAREVVRTGLSVHALASFLDYLGTLLFVGLREKTKPHFSLIFLNVIAHLQHQFWNRTGELHPEMKLGLRLADRMLGLLVDSLAPHEALIVMNGLKQRNVDGEDRCVYRQKNPHEMLGKLGLHGAIEQSMTNDGHVLCDSKEHADEVEAGLRACRWSDGGSPFFVERASPTRVFFQVDREERLPDGARVIRGDRSVPASELFELYAVRTGAHVPVADLYARGLPIPSSLANSDVYQLVLRHFGVDELPRQGVA